MNNRTKIFLINFSGYILIFAVVSVLLGYIDAEDGGKFSFSNGYLLASFFAVIGLGVKIAMDFVRTEKINEFRIKKNLDHKEFREKYGDILDIYD